MLASNSPRRREILISAGIPFAVRAPAITEQLRDGEQATDYVCRLAREKALAVERRNGEIVLGADTVVVVNGAILEKPCDHADAARMLRLLSGCEHQVMTGLCLHGPAGTITDAAITRVRFVELSEHEISGYVASGEPMDKAGAYAIQGLASKFINYIEGCYFNVVGLPIALVYRRLKESGFTL